MPFCPNPECPHLKRTGRAAEFLGEVVDCLDCGTPLAENEIAVERRKGLPLSDFQKRLIYTLGMLALWRILAHIAPPGVNLEALDRFLGERGGEFVATYIFGFSRITVLALGLMPYVTASVAVEILALFLKPLKSWREAGYHGRLKLRRTALLATLILALVQGYVIAQGLAGMEVEDLIYNRGIGYRLFLALTLTTGTFITLWVAERITQKGIGYGISVIILASSASGLLAHLFKFFDITHKHFLSKSPFEYLFLAVGISAILIVVVIFMEKCNKRISVKYEDGMQSYIPLKLTTAGIIPADWAGYLLMLPVTVLSFINIEVFQKLAEYLSPGKLSYSIIYAVAIIFFYYLFTSIFYRPKNMIDSLKHKGGFLIVPDTKDAEDYIDRILEIIAFAGAMYLCLLFFLPEILIRLGFPIYIGGVGFILTVAIVLDLFEESNLRRKSHGLTKIMEFHDVQKAGLFRGILERQGIPCLLQGYYHRSLLYFFGPYIEISVLVPQDRSNEASKLFDRYLA